MHHHLGSRESSEMILEMKCAVESTAELLKEYGYTFDQKEVALTPSLNEEEKVWSQKSQSRNEFQNRHDSKQPSHLQVLSLIHI